jgi:hypothetical protein
MSTLSSLNGRSRYTALKGIRTHIDGTSASNRELRKKTTGATWINRPHRLKTSG